MDTRWSLSRFFYITQQNFIDAATSLHSVFNTASNPAKIEIEFYSALPHSTTSSEPFIDAWLAQENAKKISRTVDALQDVTPEMWETAKYVRARIKNKDGFASIEAKGYLPGRLTFFAYSRDNAARDAETAVKKRFPFWLRGDGFFSYHHDVTYG